MPTAVELAEEAFSALSRGDSDAAVRFAAALQAQPASPDLLIGDAEARLRSGTANPLDRLAGVVARQQQWVEGQAALAAMRWESGDRMGFLDGFKAALALYPSNAALWNAYIHTLAGAEQYGPAADAAAAARKLFDVPTLRLIEASHAGRAGDLARAGALLETVPPDFAERLNVEAWHLIRTGDLAAAERCLAVIRERSPNGIDVWGVTELVWRKLGDSRTDWLSQRPGLVRVIDLAIEADRLTALADTLRTLHRSRSQPLSQSVRGGTQTRGPLFQLEMAQTRELQKLLQAAVDDYRAKLPPEDSDHPLLRHRNRSLRVDGGWSVRLVGSGFHVSHLHQGGIVSSACYVSLPQLDPARQEGWLELGRPPAHFRLELAPLQIVEPIPARLVLFPSFLYHGTRPFGTGERLTIAFDAA